MVAALGPASILVAVLFILRTYVVGNNLPAHVDDLSWFLPNYCALGRTLASGHIALWNPSTLSGVPFAADPQSGWMYLPAMLSFSVLPCVRAFRALIVLQPLLAGLGVYGFLRSERASRPAATAGGMVAALVLADSGLVAIVPFTGAIAWASVTLAAASRATRAATWPARCGWTLAAAAAWGQIAAAHLSYGAMLGSIVVLAYLVARVAAPGEPANRRALAGTALLLVAAAPLVNLAYLLPRLAYLPGTNLGLGYARMQSLSQQLWGHAWSAGVFGHGIAPSRALAFGVSPGPYLGAVGLAVSFGGWRCRRHRATFVALALFATACYLAAQDEIVAVVARHAGDSRLAGLYLHAPSLLLLGTLMVAPMLIGLGVDGWLEARTLRTRSVILLPAVVTWWLLPWMAGPRGYTPLFVAGSAAAALALTAVALRPSLAPVLPALLAVELVANGLIGLAGGTPPAGGVLYGALRRPPVDGTAFVSPGPIAAALASSQGRFLSLDPSAYRPLGYQVQSDPAHWPLLGMQQSMLFGLTSAQGYDPVQPLRYWEFARAIEPKPMKYNVTYFVHPPSTALDLLGVTDVIAPVGNPPYEGAVPVAAQGAYALYVLPSRSPSPLATVVTAWRVVASADGALAAVRAPEFAPSDEVILEREPGLPAGAGAGAGRADPLPSTGQDLRLDISTNVPAVVLVRIPFQPGWHATVDGHPVADLAADFVAQGVPVPAGHHLVVLRYEDPALGAGLFGSALAVTVLAAAASIGWLRRRGRRAPRGRYCPPQGGHCCAR